MRAIEIEELAWRWQEALEAAQSATSAESAVVRGNVTDRHFKQLAAERKDVVQALEGVARVHRLDVHLAHLALPAYAVQQLLGLPADVTACVFNLDGVLVPSAAVHAAAWKETFDAFILERAERTRGRFAPFDPVGDYSRHLHGRPRLDGVRDFLASRGIRLPEGHAEDAPGTETVHGLANRKKEALLRRLQANHLEAFAGSRLYLEIAREAGIHRVAVSASANAPQMIEGAGFTPLIESCVDGRTMELEHLRSKPEPDVLLAALAAIGADPHRAVAFETTAAGVEAARSAGFELVVGVDPGEAAGALRRGGADQVVTGLAELLERQAVA